MEKDLTKALNSATIKNDMVDILYPISQKELERVVDLNPTGWKIACYMRELLARRD